MRTKFTINDEVFGSGMTLSECYQYFEQEYKQHGFILDKERDDAYIIFDKEINLNEGDRVYLYATRIISYKCVDLVNDIIEYLLVEE